MSKIPMCMGQNSNLYKFFIKYIYMNQTGPDITDSIDMQNNYVLVCSIDVPFSLNM